MFEYQWGLDVTSQPLLRAWCVSRQERWTDLEAASTYQLPCRGAPG